MSARGFTLVEILVALVVLEVGLLGVVGSLVLAARTLDRAVLLERGVAQVARVHDSLAVSGAAVGSGSFATADGVVTWTIDGSGRASISFARAVGSPLVTIDARLPPAAPVR